MQNRIKKEIEKLKGKGINIHVASEMQAQRKYIPSGSLRIDQAIGSPGYPIPKFIQLFGPESSGKSTLALVAASNVTSKQKLVIMNDTENNYDTQQTSAWRQKLGVDLNYVIDIPGNQDAEEILDANIALLKKYPDEIKLIILDSIGGLATTKLQKKDLQDGHIDDVPKLMSRFCRLINSCNKGAAVIAISMISANIGGMSHEPVPLGGNAIKHWDTLLLHITHSKSINEDRDGISTTVKKEMNIKVKKNKQAFPGRRVTDLVFDLEHGCFDTIDELLTVAHQQGIMQRKGAYLVMGEYSYYRQQWHELLSTSTEWFNYMFHLVMGKAVEEYYGTF